jgi:flagellar hook-associated protein 1 FlgK
VDSQTSVTAMLSAQQNSVSGVSTDEEMTSLLGYQQAYNASAEVLKTVNAMMTTTLAMIS